MAVFQVNHSRHHVAVLCNLWTNRYGGIGVRLSDFILHEPTGEIEIVNRVVVEQHAIELRLIGGDRWSIFVAPNRLEQDGLSNLAGFNPFHRRRIGGIVRGTTPPLQSYTS